MDQYERDRGNHGKVGAVLKELAPGSRTDFALGDLVRLTSDPSKTGAIIERTAGHPEGRYTVFVDGEQAR